MFGLIVFGALYVATFSLGRAVGGFVRRLAFGAIVMFFVWWGWALLYSGLPFESPEYNAKVAFAGRACAMFLVCALAFDATIRIALWSGRDRSRHNRKIERL